MEAKPGNLQLFNEEVLRDGYSVTQESSAFIQRDRLFESMFYVVFRIEDTRDLGNNNGIQTKVFRALFRIDFEMQIILTKGATLDQERGDIWAQEIFGRQLRQKGLSLAFFQFSPAIDQVKARYHVYRQVVTASAVNVCPLPVPHVRVVYAIFNRLISIGFQGVDCECRKKAL